MCFGQKGLKLYSFPFFSNISFHYLLWLGIIQAFYDTVQKPTGIGFPAGARMILSWLGSDMTVLGFQPGPSLDIWPNSRDRGTLRIQLGNIKNENLTKKLK